MTKHYRSLHPETYLAGALLLVVLFAGSALACFVILYALKWLLF